MNVRVDLVDVRGDLVDVALGVRQTSPNPASPRHTSHEGARMLPVLSGTFLPISLARLAAATYGVQLRDLINAQLPSHNATGF